MSAPSIDCAHLEGSWPKDDIRRAFVEGAKWMLWQMERETMFASERELAEAEAEKRYPK